ncbi:CPK4 [Symbiodinium necroappetens]|uniref:CPK4 protein n=1 Tax=Symbiodinium necroappetens TaxID=1628268 RepID=A0A812PJM3_9DINO|nr:CPK4 [Symbiodinium necroappetens]
MASFSPCSATRYLRVLLVLLLERVRYISAGDAEDAKITCAHLQPQVCSHRGNHDDSELQLLSAMKMQDLLNSRHSIHCADLDLTRIWASRRDDSALELVVGHPDDFERLVPSAVRRRNGSTAVEIDLKKIPRDMGKALQLTQLLLILQTNSARFVAFEIKDMDLAALELTLQTLHRAGMAGGCKFAVWYSPADVDLFQQVHRKRYPEIKSILAMYDRPWKGNPAASLASLDEAAEGGFDMVGPSIDVSETLLSKAVRQGFSVMTYGISTEEHVMKAARTGVQYMATDKPVWLQSQLEMLRSKGGCGGPGRLLAALVDFDTAYAGPPGRRAGWGCALGGGDRYAALAGGMASAGTRLGGFSPVWWEWRHDLVRIRAEVVRELQEMVDDASEDTIAWLGALPPHVRATYETSDQPAPSRERCSTGCSDEGFDMLGRVRTAPGWKLRSDERYARPEGLDRLRENPPIRGQDPWGCAMAGKQEEEPSSPEAETMPKPKRRPQAQAMSERHLSAMCSIPAVSSGAIVPCQPPATTPSADPPSVGFAKKMPVKNVPKPPATPPPAHIVPAKARPGAATSTAAFAKAKSLAVLPSTATSPPDAGMSKAVMPPSPSVAVKAMPRKTMGDGSRAQGDETAFAKQASSLSGPAVSEGSEPQQGNLSDLPRLLEETGKEDDRNSEDEDEEAAAKAAKLPHQMPAVRSLMGLDDSRLSEYQMELVKDLASGSKFHDPARDPQAYRKQARNMCLVEVSRLKFCHKDIGPRFSHGSHQGVPVLKLLQDLHAGRADPKELPPLVVMRNRGDLQVVCGNRRLYCLKRFAMEASKAVDVWCVVYDLKAKDTPRPLLFKYILATTTQDSNTVSARVR